MTLRDARAPQALAGLWFVRPPVGPRASPYRKFPRRLLCMNGRVASLSRAASPGHAPGLIHIRLQSRLRDGLKKLGQNQLSREFPYHVKPVRDGLFTLSFEGLLPLNP
jgi:hypothetical protein